MCFNLSTFTGAGFSSTTGSGFSSTIGSTGSTDSLTILMFGLALDFDFGFALGLISYSKIVSLIGFSFTGSSFTGSPLLFISIISSLVSSADILTAYIY